MTYCADCNSDFPEDPCDHFCQGDGADCVSSPCSALSGYDALRMAVEGGATECQWPSGRWRLDGEDIRFTLMVPSADGDGGHRVDIKITPDDIEAEFF